MINLLALMLISLSIIAFAAPFSIPVGKAPSEIIYQKYIYVANYNSSTVSVIDPSSDTVIQEINVGTNPDSLIYANGYIFVADSGSNEVSVIQNDRVIKNITGIISPYSLAYDNLTNQVFVSESVAHQIAVIDVNNLSLVRSFTLPFPPGSLLYSNKVLYVAELSLGTSGFVYVINPNNGQILNFYTIGGYPVSISCYDGNVFITSWYNNKLTIINSSGFYQFNAGLYPFYAVYDPDDGYIYVSDINTSSIIAMTSSGHLISNITVGDRPSYMVYVNGKIYVSLTLGNSVYVIPQIPPPSPPLGLYLFIIAVIIIVLIVGFLSIRRQLKKPK